MNTDLLIKYGGTVKTLEKSGDLVTIGGTGVVFDEHSNPVRDLTGDYFSPDSYYGAHKGNGMDVMLHHGIPLGDTEQFQRRASHLYGPAKVEEDDSGLFVSVVLDLRKQYERDVYELSEQKALDWSSGALGHGVIRTSEGWLKRWLIGEWSLTPSPAEPRTSAIPIKSFLRPESGLNDSSAIATMAILNLKARLILTR